MTETTDDSTNVKEKIVSLRANLPNFSNESLHKPGVVTSIFYVSLEEDSSIECIIGAYYGNGNSEENEGYVSLVFNCQVALIFKSQHDFNFSCVVAVEDRAGNNKFVRTFTFPACEDLLAVYSIDRYIKRETILDNRDDLLPNDELTLNVNIHLQAISSNDNSAEIESAVDASFELKEDSEGIIIVLHLNSELSKSLYEVSSVFRALCDNPMIESSTRLVYLPDDDLYAFRNAAKIIMGAKKITFNTFDEIIRLYVFADKYDIQNVIRACRKFCKNILDVENSLGSFDLVEERINKISQVATFFSDDDLKEIVDRFLKNLKADAVETRKKCEHRYVKLDPNMKCEYKGESPYLFLFRFEEDKDGDRSEFEFYN